MSILHFLQQLRDTNNKKETHTKHIVYNCILAYLILSTCEQKKTYFSTNHNNTVITLPVGPIQLKTKLYIFSNTIYTYREIYLKDCSFNPSPYKLVVLYVSTELYLSGYARPIPKSLTTINLYQIVFFYGFSLCPPF